MYRNQLRRRKTYFFFVSCKKASPCVSCRVLFTALFKHSNMTLHTDAFIYETVKKSQLFPLHIFEYYIIFTTSKTRLTLPDCTCIRTLCAFYCIQRAFASKTIHIAQNRAVTPPGFGEAQFMILLPSHPARAWYRRYAFWPFRRFRDTHHRW